MLKRLAAVFTITATAASLLALVLKPWTVLAAWGVAFLVTMFFVLVRAGLLIVTMHRGFANILDFLADLIESGVREDVFAFASYNATDEIMGHDYMRRTDRLLSAGHFDAYTRVSVLRTKADVDSCLELLRKHYRNPKFSLAVYQSYQPLQLNLLAISPRTVVLGFPRLPLDGAQADTIALRIRSQTVYSSVRPLCEAVWQNAIRLKERGILSDAELVKAESTLADLWRAQPTSVSPPDATR